MNSHALPSKEELDSNVACHLLGPCISNLDDPNQPPMSRANSSCLAGEIGMGSSSSFHDHDPFQELLRQLTDSQLMEQYPLSMHCGGDKVDNCDLESIGSDWSASSVGFQAQEGSQNERYRQTLMYMAKRGQPGCESSGKVTKMPKENTVDAYFKNLVHESNLKETMTDPMMSKEFQDLVGRCSGILRDEIVGSLRSADVPLLQVCLNPNGTQSLLKLFEHLSEFSQRQSIATTLSHFVTSLFKDDHGQKVIEFCLRNFLDMENVHIFLEVEKHLLEIAMDLRGCCMLMKCMEISKGLWRDLLFRKTTEKCSELAVHPTGNYLVQKLFDFDIPQLIDDTLRSLQGSYHFLSVDKYGSHVMEKCLLRSNRNWFDEIAWELVNGQDFTELFTDPYGNYVIQAMLSQAKDYGSVIYDILRTMIDSEGEALKSSPYGGKLLKLIRRPNNRSRSSFCRGSGH